MRRRATQRLAIGSTAAVFALIAVIAIAPPPEPTSTQLLEAYITSHAQRLQVSTWVSAGAVERGHYSATPAIDTFVNGGTNYDWAKLVLLSGGWPLSDANVTVFVRWMRQENGPNNWWNRDNPLNNGFGSGGAGGTGHYDNLVVAAQKVAQNIHRSGGMAGIAAAFAASAPTSVTESAIWGSNWATGHYAYGGHWSYAPVPVVKAPASAW